MNLFIDTNILLSFYHFKSDDLEELKKLAVLIEKKKVIFFLTDQVVNEFSRNRENKIADSLKRLKDQKLNFQFPQFCKDYPDYEKLRELQRDYATTHTELIKKITEDIDSKKLKADETIEALFSHANRIANNEKIIRRARERMDLGNPPGKTGSLGDAINWEILLDITPNGENIYFITDDKKDFCSPLDDNAFNSFLLEEWSLRKSSYVVFYKSLSACFREHFPEIKLASEFEKDLIIRDLTSSGSFARTHTIIANLNQYSDFTLAQVNAILEAAISNNQIYWIINDSDVEGFLNKIIKGKEDQIDQEKLKDLKKMLEPIPF